MKILSRQMARGISRLLSGPEEYRIKVLAWRTLEKLNNVYHVRPKSIQLLLTYLPVVGPGGLFEKRGRAFAKITAMKNIPRVELEKF